MFRGCTAQSITKCGKRDCVPEHTQKFVAEIMFAKVSLDLTAACLSSVLCIAECMPKCGP